MTNPKSAILTLVSMLSEDCYLGTTDLTKAPLAELTVGRRQARLVMRLRSQGSSAEDASAIVWDSFDSFLAGEDSAPWAAWLGWSKCMELGQDPEAWAEMLEEWAENFDPYGIE